MYRQKCEQKFESKAIGRFYRTLHSPKYRAQTLSSVILCIGLSCSIFTATIALAAPQVSTPATNSAAKSPSVPASPVSPPPAVPVVKTPIVPYLLAGEDVLDISVVNFINLSSHQIVAPDGMITVSLLEPVSVLGKTTGEVAQMLTEKWRKYIINPSVSVTLAARRRENVLIYGCLIKSGTLEYRLGMRLTEALAEMGGTLTAADTAHLVVTHKSGEKRVIDVSHPETKAGGDLDIVLQPGDVIYVPEHHMQISVLGEVNHPGSQDYKEDMTVLDALTAFGGVKETADLGTATLLRNGKETKLDMEALLRRGDLRSNIKLQAGDRLMLPEFRNRTYVYGSVNSAGYYICRPGDRVLDALKACGGPGKEADLSKINVIHINKEKNSAEVVKVNLDKFLKKGDLTGNMLLLPGDVLYVPDKRHAFALGDLFGVLTGLNLLDSLGRIFTKGLGSN